jgi:predicted NUDIX family NTP pyrophosphohydrolase
MSCRLPERARLLAWRQRAVAARASSAGILLHRRSEFGIEVLLVHPGGPFWARKDLGAWSIPKGELDGDEDPRDCALREFAEETGTRLPRSALEDLGSVRQKSGKLVFAFAVEGEFDPATLASNTFELEWPPRSGRMRAFPEIDRAEWFGLDAARGKLNPAQAEFVDRLEARLAS